MWIRFENIDNFYQAKEQKAKNAKRPKFRDFTNINGKKAKRKKEAINKHVTLRYIMDTLWTHYEILWFWKYTITKISNWKFCISDYFVFQTVQTVSVRKVLFGGKFRKILFQYFSGLAETESFAKLIILPSKLYSRANYPWTNHF